MKRCSYNVDTNPIVRDEANCLKADRKRGEAETESYRNTVAREIEGSIDGIREALENCREHKPTWKDRLKRVLEKIYGE